jgi:hypothetical protein
VEATFDLLMLSRLSIFRYSHTRHRGMTDVARHRTREFGPPQRSPAPVQVLACISRREEWPTRPAPLSPSAHLSKALEKRNLDDTPAAGRPPIMCS